MTERGHNLRARGRKRAAEGKAKYDEFEKMMLEAADGSFSDETRQRMEENKVRE